MKQVMDIEAVLHWAFGMMAIDKAIAQNGGSREFDAVRNAVLREIGPPRAPSDRSFSDVLAQISTIGTPVHAGRVHGCRGLTAAAEDYADAVAVFDAALAAPDLFVELTPDGAILWDDAAAAAIGATITKGRGAYLFADGAYRALEPANVFVMLVSSARLGVSPGWHPTDDFGGLAPRRGRPSAEDEERRLAAWRAVTLARARYSAWHLTMARLVDALDDLRTIVVTGPIAPAAPWLPESVLVSREPATEGDFAQNSTGAKPLKKRAKKSA